MTQPTKRELKPRLRFPEFRDAGEWEEKRLDDFATIVRGGSPRPIDEYVTKDTNGLNWLKIGDIDKESKFVTSTQEKVIPAALTKTRVVNPGDLILSNSMSFGRPYILKIQTCIHDGWIAVSEIIKSLDRDYLYYLMMTSDSQTYFSDNSAGSGVQNLNAEIIKLLPVSYPHKKEQQKIADCLSSIDDLITAQTQKLATLKTHKKGLMQQLFPAEGETLPKLRFPEFRDAGEWEPLPIGKKVDLLSGYPFDGIDISENSCGTRLLRGINITEGRIRHSKDIDRYYFADTGGLEKYNLKKNDLVIGMDGSKVGKNVALITSSDIGALLVQRVARLRSDCVTSIQFIFQQINSNKFHAYVDRINTSSGIPHISAKQINDFQISFPSINEQQRISGCLSSIDGLIAAQTQKLSTLKTHKKALMQQLFPTLEEVSS